MAEQPQDPIPQGSGLVPPVQAPTDAGQASIIKVMSEGGFMRVSPDTGAGSLRRPVAMGREGARTATLETLFDYFFDNVTDPDFAQAYDPNFLDRMRQCPAVHAAMRKREVSVASLPQTWKPSSERGVDPAEAQLMCDYCQDVWRSIPNVVDMYRQMQTAVLHGGIGHEFLWARDSEGVNRPVAFFPVHKSRFVFDRLGNMALLTRNTPVWGSYVKPAAARVFGEYAAFPAPPGKFTYHKYMAEGGSWQFPAGEGFLYYGRGEDTNLYWIIKFEQYVVRYRMKWLEKHGIPLTVLYYPEGVVAQSYVDNIGQQVQNNAVIAIGHPAGTPPEEWFSIQFIEPPSIGYDAFNNFSREYTEPAIEKVLLGGADQMSLGDVGGYSATMNQREAGEAILFRYDAMQIDETINAQLVPQIIRSVPRWANVPISHMPKHMLTPEREKNRLQELQILQTLAQAVPVKKEAFYEAAGQQKPKDGSDGSQPEEVVFLGQAQPGGDIWSAMGEPGTRNPDTRGLASVDSPRQEQTREAMLQRRSLGGLSKQVAGLKAKQGESDNKARKADKAKKKGK